MAQEEEETRPATGENDNAREESHELALAKTKSIAETFSLPHEIAFVFIICMAQLMTQASLGQVLAILHIIGDSFGITNPGILSWLIAAYSLTVGTFILPAGRLGDLFGYKKLFLIGFAWFGLWSLVAGLAVYSNYILFAFARALQGIGPSLMLPNALAILGATYPPGPRKNMCFALFGAVAPGGAVIGGAFASIFAQLAWWPWTFFAGAIACFGCAAAGALIIPSPPPSSSQAEPAALKRRDLDLPGAATGVAALVTFNIAWNQAPVVGWQEPYVYVLLILGVLLAAAFFVWELKFAHSPLIPLRALNPDVAFVLGCIACGWGSFGIWVFYNWQFLQTIRGASPLLSVAMYAPVGISGLCAAVTTGVLLHRVRPAWIMTVALCAFTVGMILVATAPVRQTYWAQTFVSLIVMPWGMDMSFPAATIILSNAVARRHQGIAASLVNTVVNYSISLGLGFAGTVEVHVDDGGKNLLKGYRGAWYMGIGLSGLGVVVSLLFVARGYWRERHPKGGGAGRGGAEGV